MTRIPVSLIGLSSDPCCSPRHPNPPGPSKVGQGKWRIKNPSLTFCRFPALADPRERATPPLRAPGAEEATRSAGSSAPVWPSGEAQPISQPRPFGALIEEIFIEVLQGAAVKKTDKIPAP